jgi:hypothetical protein
MRINQVSKKVSERMGRGLILDALWESQRTLTVSETVGKLATLVVYLLFALAFAGGMVYYIFFQSTTTVIEVSILSMKHLSGVMPNASLTLQDGQSENLTEWTCKMVNRYPILATSNNVNNVASSYLGIGEFKDKSQWTPLQESYLPKSTFAKSFKIDDSCMPTATSDSCPKIEFPATLAPDLVQKYRESLQVSDADFRSYCDLLKKKNYISDTEKNLCVEMFTKKFESAQFCQFSGSNPPPKSTGCLSYDIETFPDTGGGSSNRDSQPMTGDSPILRVEAQVPNVFVNGITLPTVTPGLQFPSISHKECVELVSTTVTAKNAKFNFVTKGSGNADFIIRDISNFIVGPRTRDLFQRIDTNKDSRLQFSELKSFEYIYVSETGSSICVYYNSSTFTWYPDCNQFIRKFDKSGDGALDVEEFHKWAVTEFIPNSKDRTYYWNDMSYESDTSGERSCAKWTTWIEYCDGVDCNGEWKNCKNRVPFITFPGSPIGMPFFFQDFKSYEDPGILRDYYLHTDITFTAGATRKKFRIFPPFNEEIFRNAFQNAGLPLNASEICEFYRHSPPYQCSHTQTVTTRNTILSAISLSNSLASLLHTVVVFILPFMLSLCTRLNANNRDSDPAQEDDTEAAAELGNARVQSIVASTRI